MVNTIGVDKYRSRSLVWVGGKGYTAHSRVRRALTRVVINLRPTRTGFDWSPLLFRHPLQRVLTFRFRSS